MGWDIWYTAGNPARRLSMSRPPKDPLRPLTEEERTVLTEISRSFSEPASHVARAKALLAVVNGKSYTAAAKAAGRRAPGCTLQP